MNTRPESITRRTKRKRRRRVSAKNGKVSDKQNVTDRRENTPTWRPQTKSSPVISTTSIQRQREPETGKEEEKGGDELEEKTTHCPEDRVKMSNELSYYNIFLTSFSFLQQYKFNVYTLCCLTSDTNPVQSYLPLVS